MAQGPLLEEQLTRSVIGAFYRVYNSLGYGFLEHLYALALERELLVRKHEVAREVMIPVRYEDQDLGLQRLDMVVDAKLIVEIKSTEQLHKIARRQLYNYLKASGLQVGLLLHFGAEPCFYRMICSRSSITPPAPCEDESPASEQGPASHPPKNSTKPGEEKEIE